MPNKQTKQMMHNDEDGIVAIGHCEIVASEAEGGKKTYACNIAGYNGGKMSVGYWGPIVIDLNGIELPADGKMPILYAHETWSIESILGQTSSIKNDKKTLQCSGEIMPVTDLGKQVVEFAASGFSFQASVGARPLEYKEVPEGVEVEINGQMVSGPFTHIVRSVLKEISIVPLGADSGTSTTIAASQTDKEGIMPGKEVTPQTVEEIRAAAVAEEARITAIRAECKDHAEIAAKAIAEGWSLERVQNEVLRAENAKMKADIEASKRPPIDTLHIGGRAIKAKVDEKALIAAACIAGGMGRDIAATSFGAEVCNVAEDMRIRSLSQLVNASLAAAGINETVDRHEPERFVKAAFSTASVANVLSGTARKFMLAGYGAVDQSWRKIAQVIPVNDFKKVSGVRLIMSGLLGDINGKGELSHVSLSDEAQTIQAKTKGSMITIGRQDIINDDLGILADIPKKFGFMAARTFNRDFWEKLTDNEATMFTTALGNRMTGVLSLANLATADQKFRDLKDKDDNPLGLVDGFLIVSNTNRAKALELFKSTGLIGGTSKDVATNVFAGTYEPVCPANLTGAPWLLAANPNVAALMRAAFLYGNDMPVVETAEAAFNQLGINIRCYYDYGVETGDSLAGVYSTGA